MFPSQGSVKSVKLIAVSNNCNLVNQQIPLVVLKAQTLVAPRFDALPVDSEWQNVLLCIL